MTDNTPLVKELRPVYPKLTDLFLDPNNPRFVGPTWEYISSEQICDKQVQENTRKKLVESFDIDRLRESIEMNGYLPIDTVVVRRLSDKKYVVLEGNRRICAAKMVGELSTKGEAISKGVRDSLEQIPCQEYIGTEKDAAWVFQGLRHISGIRDWPAYNKARLLVEQMEENDLTLNDVGRRFGISHFVAGQWKRAYKAFEQARSEAEKAALVGQEAFPYFQEMFNRSCVKLRDWVSWDEKESKFDPIRLSEFVDWLYPTTEEDEGQAIGTSGFELFQNRKIKQAIDLRRLSEILTKSPEAFESFRINQDLAATHADVMYREHFESQEKNLDQAKELLDAVEKCARLLENVPLKLVNDSQFAGHFKTKSQLLTDAIEFVRKAMKHQPKINE